MCAIKKGATARALSLSLGRKRSTRACDVRAPRRAGWSRSMPYESPLRQREGHLPLCTPVFRHVSRCANEQTELACAHTRSRHCTHSLGRRRTTRAYDVRVPLRAGWSSSVLYYRPLRQRDGPLPRCTAVLRHTSRGLQRADGVRVCAHAIAPLHALSREEVHHAHLRRARAAPRWLESVHTL